MTHRRSLVPLFFALMLPCCGDDSPVASGGTDTDATAGDDGAPTGGDDDGVDDTGDDDGDDGNGPCVADSDCDDDDPCTADVCGSGTCEHEPIVDNACRPQIDVEFPPRGATVLGQPGSSTVTVTGQVSSGVAEIESLTLGGAPVTIAADGSFSHDVQANVGGNLLVFETADAMGNTRRRVQSFLWATAYELPTTPPDGVSEHGLAFWLGQETIDDGDRTPPLDDIASLLQLVLDGFDPSTVFDPTTPIASQAGYDIYLTDLTIGSSNLNLTASDGGIRLGGSLDDIDGDLFFDCTTAACVLAGGDGTGGLSITTIGIDATLALTVDSEHGLQAEIQNVDVILNPDHVNIWSDNWWTDFLLTVVEVFIHDGLVSDLEAQLETTVENDLGPALAGGISGLTLGTSFEFPNLGNARMPIVVDLYTDFLSTDFHDGQAPPSPSPPAGGAVFLRGGGYSTTVESRYENLGVPQRMSCGDEASEVALARSAPLEIGLSDDLLNSLLHAGWRGGLLEFPLGGDQLGGGMGGIIEDLEVQVSGMLAPTASDCAGDGTLLATIGDIRIDGSLTLLKQPVTFTAYTTLVVRLDIQASESGIAIDLAQVERVETELTANDEAIDVEPTLVMSLESQLVDGLLGQLGDLGSISLPQIDLSTLIGQPAGTAVLEIHVDGAQRTPGTTIVSAHL
jgi:hypothetical protein